MFESSAGTKKGHSGAVLLQTEAPVYVAACSPRPPVVCNLQAFPFHRIEDTACFISVLIDTSLSLPAPSLPPTLLLPWQESLSTGSAGPVLGLCGSSVSASPTVDLVLWGRQKHPCTLAVPQQAGGGAPLCRRERRGGGGNDLPKGSSYHPAQQVAKFKFSTLPINHCDNLHLPQSHRGLCPISSDQLWKWTSSLLAGPVMAKTLASPKSQDPLRTSQAWGGGKVQSLARLGERGLDRTTAV